MLTKREINKLHKEALEKAEEQLDKDVELAEEMYDYATHRALEEKAKRLQLLKLTKENEEKSNKI